jgi:two-component system response regulator
MSNIKYMNDYQQIVIVDDDKESQRLFEIAFAQAHITNPLIFANDGEELLEFLRRSSRQNTAPGIILLDLNMPKMSGLEALRLMKQNEDWKRIPVIIFSNSDYEVDIDQAYKLGAAGYIVKPNSFDKLILYAGCIKNYWLDYIKLPRPNANAPYKWQK